MAKNNLPHELADTVSDETSLRFAFMTGLAPDGIYVMRLNGKTKTIKMTTISDDLKKYESS